MSARSMRLLIVSHTPHYLRENRVVGWGATVREIDQLAKLFESVVHIAPLHKAPAPPSAIAYESAAVRLHPVVPSGGEHLLQKLLIPVRFPGYTGAILKERLRADVIHVRAPANISLLALILLSLFRTPTLRWAKYAGDWSRGQDEPLSYRFQRWWLRKGFCKGVVTVNGSFDHQPGHIHSFVNPCLTSGELEEGLEASREKLLSAPLQLLFIGRVERAKGVLTCLRVLQSLGEQGIAAHLHVVGGGAERPTLLREAESAGLLQHLTIHGELPRTGLSPLLRLAHFILLPSRTEGWPKVLSEAMAYGVIPIASAVGCIPEYLGKFGVGSAIPSVEPGPYVAAIRNYLTDPVRWKGEVGKASKAAHNFGYAVYLQRVQALLGL